MICVLKVLRLVFEHPVPRRWWCVGRLWSVEEKRVAGWIGGGVCFLVYARGNMCAANCCQYGMSSVTHTAPAMRD